MEQDIIDYMNNIIREEKGSRITINSSLRDADLDSFGITMLFVALDDEYQYFTKGRYSDNPFGEISYDTIMISDIVETCKLETISI